MVCNVLFPNHIITWIRVLFSDSGSRDTRCSGNPVNLNNKVMWHLGHFPLTWRKHVPVWQKSNLSFSLAVKVKKFLKFILSFDFWDPKIIINCCNMTIIYFWQFLEPSQDPQGAFRILYFSLQSIFFKWELVINPDFSISRKMENLHNIQFMNSSLISSLNIHLKVIIFFDNINIACKLVYTSL